MRAQMLIDPAYEALLARIRTSLRGVLPLQYYVQPAATPVATPERDYYPSVAIEEGAGAVRLVLEFVPEADAAAAARYAHYQSIASMQYVLLADLCEPRIMVLYRTPSGWDCRLHTGWRAVVDLPALECAVPLRFLYADPPYARPGSDAPAKSRKSLADAIMDIPEGDPIPDRHDDACNPADLPPRLLSVVALLVAHGAAARGSVGTVVEVLSANTCLVEFAGADGVAWATEVVPVADLIELRFGAGRTE